SFLTTNPPSPGRPPSAEEISAAVSEYFVRNPPPAGRPGEDGRDGEPGRPPTAEEIRAAVDSFLAANPPPPGKDGQPGPPGAPPQSFTMSLNGATQTCNRSGGTDTAPTYTCSGPTAPSTPEPGENQDGES